MEYVECGGDFRVVDTTFFQKMNFGIAYGSSSARKGKGGRGKSR